MDYQLLIIRHLAGETKVSEEALLQHWLSQSADHRKEYEALKQAWELGAIERLPEADQLYQRIEKELEDKPHTSRLRQPTFLAAAMLSIFLVSAYLLWIYTPLFNPENRWHTVNTQKGELQQISLEDGTIVYLNTASELKSAFDYNTKERRVKLRGEAFFDVARDTSKPFIIELPEGQVQVLGTSFNVRAYADDHNIETTVKSGKVAFRHDEQAEANLILPNEKLSFSKKENTIKKEAAEVTQSLAWMEQKIVFQAHTLKEIAKELEHYFEIDIVFENDELQNCSMTGTFKNTSYREILNALRLTNAFKFREEGNRVIIYGDGCI